MAFCAALSDPERGFPRKRVRWSPACGLGKRGGCALWAPAMRGGVGPDVRPAGGGAGPPPPAILLTSLPCVVCVCMLGGRRGLGAFAGGTALKMQVCGEGCLCPSLPAMRRRGGLLWAHRAPLPDPACFPEQALATLHPAQAMAHVGVCGAKGVATGAAAYPKKRKRKRKGGVGWVPLPSLHSPPTGAFVCVRVLSPPSSSDLRQDADGEDHHARCGAFGHHRGTAFILPPSPPSHSHFHLPLLPGVLTRGWVRASRFCSGRT
jgi:hypothetical protein